MRERVLGERCLVTAIARGKARADELACAVEGASVGGERGIEYVSH
jgi:hypothetical protein